MSFDVTPSIPFSGVMDYHGVAYEREAVSKLGFNDLFRAPVRISGTMSIPELVQIIQEAVGKPILSTLPIHKHIIISFEDFVAFTVSGPRTLDKISRSPSIYLNGRVEEVQRVHDYLEEKYPYLVSSNIDWYYEAEKRPQRKVMRLEHNHTALDEFFPWIKSGVAQFQRDFLDSESNVLLLIGEPGCGKTTFIRDMIRRNNLDTAVTYDENLMGMDSFFIEFINKEHDLLVIEDADVILRDRQDGNKVMSKLLNASDGLIQTRKKIIFTANLTNLDEIDPALIRPGRCFEALRFRELTVSEARVAAAAASLPEPDGPRTLSQLFAKGPSTKVTSRVGFTLP